MTYYSSELYHHGIKGMKWGVRRYQNEDGTLTKAGEKRYYGKVKAIQKDIDSFNPIRGKGVKTKSGKEILTKEDVEQAVKGLETARDLAQAKGDARRQKDYKKMTRKVKDSEEYKNSSSTKKKVLIGAAVVAGVTLAAYGGYKLSKSESFNKALANRYIKKADKNIYMSKLASANATTFERRSRGFRAGMQYSNNADTIMKMHRKANANAQASISYRRDAEKYRKKASKYAGRATKYTNRAHRAHYTGKSFTKTFNGGVYDTTRR